MAGITSWWTPAVVNPTQACICLLYNSATTLTAADMEKQLQLSWDEVKKSLQSLALGKHRVLNKITPGAPTTAIAWRRLANAPIPTDTCMIVSPV